jgi:hypothetical protein
MDAAPTLRNGEAKGGANVKRGYYRAVKLSLFGLSHIFYGVVQRTTSAAVNLSHPSSLDLSSPRELPGNM